MKTFFALFLFAGLAIADVTISPTDMAALNAGKSVVLKGPAVVIPPPIVTPPIVNPSMVYVSGQFLWAGDWSFAGKASYTDTVGKPGDFDIAFTVMSKFGGWLPYAQGLKFDTTPYRYLVFSLKPTVANQKWSTYVVAAGDTSDGHSVDVLKYGPVPVVGVWGSYRVLLADLGMTNKIILKFAIQDQTGLSTNLWYADNVGFSN